MVDSLGDLSTSDFPSSCFSVALRYYDTLTASRSIKTCKLSLCCLESIASSPPGRNVSWSPMAFMDMFVILRDSLQILSDVHLHSESANWLCSAEKFLSVEKFSPSLKNYPHIWHATGRRLASIVPMWISRIRWLIKRSFSVWFFHLASPQSIMRHKELNARIFGCTRGKHNGTSRSSCC